MWISLLRLLCALVYNVRMQLSLLTYNFFFHQGFKDIESLLVKNNPDIACFQEMETNEESFNMLERHGYQLADYSNSFIKVNKVFCVATFFKANKFKLTESRSITLPRSYYEIFLFLLRGAHNPRTVLKTEFLTNEGKKHFTLYNLHLSPFATNGARVKQIRKTLDDLKIQSNNNILIAGDFNYPYGRKKFEELIHQYNLKEATHNIPYTFEKKFLNFFSIRLKDDYILYKNFSLLSTKRISQIYSDHFPIISSFDL